MNRFAEMRTFIAVVDKGGFTGAANALSISKSAISKHITALEGRLGARLLDRTTRRVSPTEIGLTYYEKAKEVVAAATDADDMVKAMQSSPRGKLKISAPVSFGIQFGSNAIADFLLKYEDVTVDLVLDDRFVDIIQEGYDISLRIGELADSSLKARKIAETTPIIVASPKYLEKHGTPETIDDLTDHKLLQYSIANSGTYWRIFSRSGEERQIRAVGRINANNGDVLMQACIDGLGIAYLPTFFLGDRLKTGSLRPILEDHPQPALGIHLVYPSGLYTQPKTRAFIDFMVDRFKGYGSMDW